MKIFKTFKKQTLVAISGLTMILNAGIASSSIPQASAMIDWSTFKITGYALPGSNDPVPTYTLNGQSSYSNSNVSDWLSWSADTANNASSFAASVEGTATGSGSAGVTRSASLSVSGTGLLWITASYALNAAINSTIDNGGYYWWYNPNTASASVSFNLSNYSSNSSSYSNTQANIGLTGNQWWYGNPTPTSDHKEGTLSVGVIVNNGDLLSFSSAVNAAAYDNGLAFANIPLTPEALPVPAALWLFGSVLLGFVGLCRHKQAVMA